MRTNIRKVRYTVQNIVFYRFITTHTEHYEFNGSIFKTITENEEGAYSAESYNTLGWLLEKESNDAFNNRYAVSYEYNGIGQQVAVSTPHLARGASQKVKRTEYDVYGRPTTITNPEGKVTRFTYDKLKTTADDGQQQVISTRDAQGNIVEHQDTGGTVRYTYFANGNLKTADYSGAVQRITQDGWGRKTSLTDPSAGRYTYQYDTWGNLTEETTPKGKTTFSYEQGTDRLTEKHITGDYTDMRIRYTYNADKLLTQIDNQNKDRNNDSYHYEYNGLKQLVQTTETNPQAVFTKNYTYDAFGRVQQETTTAQTAGKRVSSAVQYRYENGDLVEMKTPSGATLWKLTASNEYGQPLSLYKGKTKELLDYNSHFPKTQTVQREDTPLNVLQYDFNPQRGLLNHRTYSFYNQKEEFAYDPTDRLTRWNNATHQYDERGRITENSVIGTYEYTRNGYQQQKLTTNEAGETYLEKYPLPTVRYNAFKAPEQIYVKDKERISYEYNAFGERSHCYYGNAEVEKAKRPMLKHYSHDGSVEIVCNKTDNSTKFILYLGGDAYSAPAILISDGETQKLYYLHRDYLGSIVMLTDEDGNIAERRHFDPWGQPIKVEDGAGNTLDKLTLLDRGFTGHEHLQTVGLIHMNGRLYDPALHRFLQPDNFVQDPFNTQNFNRYGYVLNNPLLYIDPTGEYGEEGLTPNQQRGLGGLLGSLGYTIKENWPEIKDWIERNAKSTGQWFEKQGRSVGQWFSKQYNSIKEWFQGSGASSGVKTEYLTAEEVYKNQVWQIRPPTQHYFLWMNMTEMSEGNWFEQFVYNFFNDLSMPVQMMMGRSVGSSFAPMRNLNGTSMTTNDALLGFVNSASMGYSIALGGMTTGVEMTRAAVPEASNMALRVVETPKFVPHSVMRQAERGITTDMVKTVLKRAQKFYDPRNNSINYIIPNAFGSGKSILVGVDIATGKIKTVLRSSKNLIKDRMIPINK